MKKFLIISIMTIFLVCGALASVSAENTYDDSLIDGLNVSYDLSESLNDAKLENKTVMLVFDQDSCIYCEMLKDGTLSDSDVQKEINEKFIPVIIDVNKDYDTADKYDVFGTPLIVFVDDSGDEIGRIEGYVDSSEFLQEINNLNL
ncbi:MAG: thioredoxin family protein [Methanobrevibacter sp.]|nr:thioredoxin family protein [Methanobrevibacter sp.]